MIAEITPGSISRANAKPASGPFDQTTWAQMFISLSKDKERVRPRQTVTPSRAMAHPFVDRLYSFARTEKCGASIATLHQISCLGTLRDFIFLETISGNSNKLQVIL